MSQKFLDLYQLRQASIASTLHSNLAQPIVAAKNFAAAITTIQGDDEKLQEARELASVILEMTDQAYTAAYDLMRENDIEAIAGGGLSMQSAIESCGSLLRLNKRGIQLMVVEDISSISLDCFVEVIVLDWVKSLLIYLARQTKVSAITIKLHANDQGLNLEVVPDISLDSEQVDTDLVFVNMRKQLQVLAGKLFVDNTCVENQSNISILIPETCELLAVIK